MKLKKILASTALLATLAGAAPIFANDSVAPVVETAEEAKAKEDAHADAWEKAATEANKATEEAKKEAEKGETKVPETFPTVEAKPEGKPTQKGETKVPNNFPTVEAKPEGKPEAKVVKEAQTKTAAKALPKTSAVK